jgi:hypothetical protein
MDSIIRSKLRITNSHLKMHAYLVRRHIGSIAPGRLSTEAGIEYFDWIQTKSWSCKKRKTISALLLKLKGIEFTAQILLLFLTNLNEGPFFLHDLKIPEPNPIVQNAESEDVVYKWLTLGMMIRRPEYLHEHLLHNLVMWFRVETGVEGQECSGSFEAIPCELEFLHRCN